MPTKPVTTYVFATDANFSSGPASGFPTKIIPGSIAQGFVPGTGINAEWSNYLFNVTGSWLTDWVSLGSPNADLDAHIVETDSFGKSAIAALSLGGTASADTSLILVHNSGASTTAANISNTAGGSAISATATGAIPTISATSQGSGAAILGDAISFGTGFGGLFAGGGTSAAVSATGGGPGVVATGAGAGDGGTFEALGTGSGLLAERQAGGGPSVQALTSGGGSPLRGSIFLEPTAEPTAPVDGDVWKRPGLAFFGRGGLEWYDEDGSPSGGGPGKQRAWSTENGNGRKYSSSEGDSTNTTGVIQTKVTTGIGAGASPGDPLGVWDIFWQCQLRLPAGVPTTTRGIAEFHGPGGLISSHDFDFTALGQPKTWSGFVQDTIAGPQSYFLRFRTLSAPDGVVCSHARIRSVGAYE